MTDPVVKGFGGLFRRRPGHEREMDIARVLLIVKFMLGRVHVRHAPL